MPQAIPKSGPVSGSRVSTVTVARGPATATATLPRRVRASRSPRTARSTADTSGAPVLSERRQAAATRASSWDALRAAHWAQTGAEGGPDAPQQVEDVVDEGSRPTTKSPPAEEVDRILLPQARSRGIRAR